MLQNIEPQSLQSGLTNCLRFAKQRTMAGYVLGLSRYSHEPTLEAQVKFQFLRDEFDLDLIKAQVIESNLSEAEKNSSLNLLNLY